MRPCVLLLLAAASLAFAPAPQPKTGPNEKDLKRLQGVWQGVESRELESRVKGDTLSYYRDGKLVTAYRITLDATTRPRSLDLVGIGGGARDGRAYRCIYEIDGDTLRTASNGWSEPRPSSFDGPGKGRDYEAFRRKKH
jgi:uncharacterized protein (TIGR03067 family)